MFLFHALCTSLAALIAAVYDLIPSYGGSVLVATSLIFLVLSPISVRAARKQRSTATVLAAMKPRLAALKRRHADDPTTLHAKTLELYAEHGLSPTAAFGGVGGALLQAPIAIGLFTVIRGLGRVRDGFADPRFLADASSLRDAILADGGRLPWMGIDLATSPLHALGSGIAVAFPALMLVGTIAAVAWLGVRRLRIHNPDVGPIAAIGAALSPVFALTVPSGVALYLLVGALARIAQTEFVHRVPPLG